MAEGPVVEDVPIVAVVGATAVGKSEFALDLAEALGGEVINTDSMQLYRGMDIGTAKVPASQRRGVRHHLLDVLEVTEDASVAVFQQWARATVARCRGAGVVPILVGGSALYSRAVLDRFEFPGTDPSLRARLEAELATSGPTVLHAQLAALDADAASRILPSNGRRIVRALEVVQLTGRPFAASLPRGGYVDPATVQIGIGCPRLVLHERIEQRVSRMWQQGLVAEVAALESRGLRRGRTASRALGYQQVLDHLAGNRSEQEARDATVVATRRFARRQDSWFSKDLRIQWIDWDDPDRTRRALEAIQLRRSDGARGTR